MAFRLRKPLSLFDAVLHATLGVSLCLAPVWLVLSSSRSPLRSFDAGFIDGFALGVGSIFFFAIGALMIAASVATFRRWRR